MRSLLIVAVLAASTIARAQTFTTIDTPVAGRTTEQPTVVFYNNAPNIFVTDRDLTTGRTTLKWCRPTFAGSCSWTVVDGAAGDLAIPPAIAVKPIVSTIDNNLHLFYLNRISGSAVLRHATLFEGSWYFENLDGLGGDAGRISTDLFGNISAVAVAPSPPMNRYALYVSYYDATNGNLRLATRLPKSGWSFQTLDGDGADPGRINGNVGADSTLIEHQGVVNLLYTDLTNADIRQARLTSSGWHYQTIDGNGAFTTDYVVSAIAAVVSGPWLHIMYNRYAVTGIVHAWSSGGGLWGFANHDTGQAFTTGGGCSDGTAIYFPYAVGPSSSLDLKVTTSWSSSPWGFLVWDGHVNDGMRIDASVGLYSRCAGLPSRGMHVVYTQDLGGGRKAVRYAFTDNPT